MGPAQSEPEPHRAAGAQPPSPRKSEAGSFPSPSSLQLTLFCLCLLLTSARSFSASQRSSTATRSTSNKPFALRSARICNQLRRRVPFLLIPSPHKTNPHLFHGWLAKALSNVQLCSQTHCKSMGRSRDSSPFIRLPASRSSKLPALLELTQPRH